MASIMISEPESRDSRASQATGASKRFRESTHLIPTPGGYKTAKANKYNPIVMSWPVVIGTPLLMAALAVALEVALSISNKNEGFAVPARNVFQVASTQFLLSFFPTIMVLPFAFLWRELDWFVRWYQPYVLLSQGGALATESLLLDYVSLGTFFAMFYSLKFKHRVVFWSSFTAAATYLIQPLVGSVFQIQQRPQVEKSSVTSIKSIGLSPDVATLTAFVSSAGFAEAAVYNHLPDPPFVRGGWATAEFVFPPYPGFNGSMVVNTTGVQTTLDCDNPASTPTVQLRGDDTLNITVNSVDGCSQSVILDPTLAEQQYGVVNSTCDPSIASLNVTQQPVMFWFFHQRADNGQNEARAVFCKASISTFEVMATANLEDGSLTNCQNVSSISTTNNVTGAPLNGLPFNAVVFDNSTNPFIQARATATNNGIPGAIFRAASELPNGPQGTFDLPNGFLDLTSQVYRQHLALTAKSIYFVSENSTLDAVMTSYVPRLWINPLPAHAIAFILFFIGVLGAILQLISRRQRRKLLLATPPGTIAAIVALTAHSGFGELLLPYDNEETLERKLKGLKFRLDSRTGAIVADEDDGDDMFGATVGSRLSAQSEALMSLLGNNQGRVRRARGSTMSGSVTAVSPGPSPMTSSSFLASQAEYPPPSKEPFRTPYDPL